MNIKTQWWRPLLAKIKPLIHCWWKHKFDRFLKKKKNLHIPWNTANCTLGYLCWSNENICSNKNLFKNIHSNIILSSPKLEEAQMSFNRKMVKQGMVSNYYGILLSNNNEQTIDRYTPTWMTLQGIVHREGRKKNPESLYTVWFYLFNLLEIMKF